MAATKATICSFLITELDTHVSYLHKTSSSFALCLHRACIVVCERIHIYWIAVRCSGDYWVCEVCRFVLHILLYLSAAGVRPSLPPHTAEPSPCNDISVECLSDEVAFIPNVIDHFVPIEPTTTDYLMTMVQFIFVNFPLDTYKSAKAINLHNRNPSSLVRRH